MSALLGIVKGHHGAIFVHSKKGVGSTFRVLFPAFEADRGGSRDAETGIRSVIEEVSSAAADRRILVIDDEEMVLDMCANMLVRCGYDVLKAMDGAEGVELFREHQGSVACVILDLSMPRMDGIEAFAKLRAIRSDVKVILSSGYSAQEATEPFNGLGLSGFVSKPYSLGALREEVERVLSL